MTKKHFIALAAAFASHRDAIPAAAFRALVSDVANVCKAANPAFDRERFTVACDDPPSNR